MPRNVWTCKKRFVHLERGKRSALAHAMQGDKKGRRKAHGKNGPQEGGGRTGFTDSSHKRQRQQKGIKSLKGEGTQKKEIAASTRKKKGGPGGRVLTKRKEQQVLLSVGTAKA